MFIGQKEVASTTDKGEITIVSYKDGSIEEIQTKLLKASVSPEPLDATGLRDLQLRAVAGDVLLVLYDWNIRMDDFEALDAMLRTSLHQHVKAAEEKLWGMPKNEVRMQDVDRAKRQ